MSSSRKPKTVAKHVVKAVDFAFDHDKEQAIVRLQIVEGPLKGGTKMFYGSMREGFPQENTVKALRALGMTNDDVTAPDGLGSRKAYAVERENTFEGAKNPTRIDFVDPILPTKLKVPEANPAKISSTASKFKALFKSAPVLEMTPEVAAPLEVTVTEADSQPTETADSPFG